MTHQVLKSGVPPLTEIVGPGITFNCGTAHVPHLINFVRLGFFTPPEILRVGFFMDFPKSVGFSMVVFLWCFFLCKSVFSTDWQILDLTTSAKKGYVIGGM